MSTTTHVGILTPSPKGLTIPPAIAEVLEYISGNKIHLPCMPVIGMFVDISLFDEDHHWLPNDLRLQLEEIGPDFEITRLTLSPDLIYITLTHPQIKSAF